MTKLTEAKLDENQTSIDEIVERLNDFILNSAARVAKTTNRKGFTRNKRGRTENSNKKPWFGAECHRLKSKLNRAKMSLRSNPFDRGKVSEFLQSRKLYKKFLRTSEKEYRMKMTNRLLQIEENDPKAFWRTINDMRNFGAGT